MLRASAGDLEQDIGSAFGRHHFAMTSRELDHCGAPKTCGPDSYELSCNTNEDCPEQLCCVKDYDLDGDKDVILCQPICGEAVTEFVACTTDSECPSNSCVDTKLQGYAYCDKPPM